MPAYEELVSPARPLPPVLVLRPADDLLDAATSVASEEVKATDPRVQRAGVVVALHAGLHRGTADRRALDGPFRQQRYEYAAA